MNTGPQPPARNQKMGNLNPSISSILGCFQPGLWFRIHKKYVGMSTEFPHPLYLVGQVCINLILELLLHIRVCGQVIGDVAEGGTGGFVTSKDKDKSLGQNLIIT